MKKEQKKRHRKKSKQPFGMLCIVCETELSVKGGYAGTGMCGPCATGEAETLEERGERW